MKGYDAGVRASSFPVQSALSMRVLLAGGGSGGSATPVLAVAEALLARDPTIELLYVGTASGPERQLAESSGLRFASVASGKLRRYFSLSNVSDVGNVIAGLAQSLGLVRSFQPHVAFGAGGFASVPPLWAACLSGVPVHVHQQDVVPGLANRLLVPAARRISVTFRQSARAFPRGKTVVRSNPVRGSLFSGRADRLAAGFGFDPSLPLVLAAGGGTGALRLNQLVGQAALTWVERANVLHLTGVGRGVAVATESPRYAQREFLVSEMKDALAAATVMVTRAGLGTLSEIAVLGRAAIVIPMPRSHQEANARLFGAHGAARVLDEARLDARQLSDAVLELLDSPDDRERMSSAARELMRADGAELIAGDLIELAGGADRS